MHRPSGDLRFPGLVDDASIFPPGDLAMPEAVRAHGAHRAAWYAELVGPFVCSDRRLPELQQNLPAGAADGSFAVMVTVQGGAGAVEPALRWVEKDARLVLAGVEASLRDEDDLRHNAARLATVLGALLPDPQAAYVELPQLLDDRPPTSWLDALDAVAAAGHRAKFRTGGTEATAFPRAAVVAACITAALDREVAFKCTAGLHNAVRHTDPGSGFEHHGFLNVVLATHASLSGADHDGLMALLQESDPGVVAEQVAGLGQGGVDSARGWFTSFGSCSVDEPVDDLVALGLLSRDKMALP